MFPSEVQSATENQPAKQKMLISSRNPILPDSADNLNYPTIGKLVGRIGLIAFIILLLSFSALSLVAAAPAVVATIPLGGPPKAIGVNPVTNRIYTASPHLSVIDGYTNSIIATGPELIGSSGVGVNPNTNRVYITEGGRSNVIVLDGNTNNIITNITVGTVPDEVGINPVTNRIYTANVGGDNVSVINGATNSVIASVPVGVTPFGIAVNPVTNRIYTANFNSDTVSVIDGVTNSVTATIQVGDGPRAVTVNPDTNRIYVVNYFSYSVSIIDGNSNNIIKNLPLGFDVRSIEANPATNRIYVADIGSDKVWIIDGGSDSIVGTVRVDWGPIALALNPDTNRIYTANNYAQTVSVIEDKVFSTTLNLSNTPSPAYFGQPVTFTATLDAITTTGTVTFREGNSILGSVNVNNGVATYITNTLSVGSHVISATYSGNITYASSISTDITQVIDKASSSISLTSSANPVVINNNVTLTATVIPPDASGLVTFTFNGITTTTSPVVNGLATYMTNTLPADTYTVTATYSGNINYLSSTSSYYTQIVTKIATILTVASSPNPSPFGQNATFTATITPPEATGRVIFTVGGAQVNTPIFNGVATFMTSSFPSGDYLVNAVYSGSAVYSASVSMGQYTHTVSPPLHGTIQWESSTYSVGEGAGTALITATRTGGSDGAVSATVVITDGTATSTDYTTPPNLVLSWAAGESGSKTFQLPIVNDTVYEGNESLQLGLTNPLGGATIANPATATLIIVEDDLPNTSLSLSSQPNPSQYGQNITFTATVNAVAPGSGIPSSGVVTFTFEGIGNVTANVSAGVAKYVTHTLAVGSHQVSASYSGNAQYLGSSSSSPLVQVVEQTSVSVSLISSPNPAVVGSSVSFSATIQPVSASGVVTFSFNGLTFTTSPVVNGLATYMTDTLAVGTYTVTAIYSGDANYLSSISQASNQTIVPACNPQVVTSNSDNGQATSCGTFSYALATTTNGTISFALANGHTITFTDSLAHALAGGVGIDGGATGIILNGNGVVGDGLRLSGNNQLANLTIQHFAGRELVAVGSSATSHLFKVRVQS